MNSGKISRPMRRSERHLRPRLPRRSPGALALALLAALCLAQASPALCREGSADEALQAMAVRIVQDDGRPRRLSESEAKELRERLDTFLSERPNSSQALLLRGLTNYELRNFRSARADFEHAARAAPKMAAAHYNLGRTLETLGQWPEARIAYERAAEADPQLLAVQFNLGRLYEAAGELKRAESAYYAAWLAEPRSEEALVALGNIRYRQGDLRGALVYFEQAGARTRGSSVIDHNRGLALEALGRYEEARGAYADATDRAPRRADSRMGWARCAYRLGRWEELETALDPVASLSGEYQEEARTLLEAARKLRAEEAQSSPLEGVTQGSEKGAKHPPGEKGLPIPTSPPPPAGGP